MRLKKNFIGRLLLLIPLLVAGCVYEDIDEIVSPSKDRWNDAPVFASGDEVVVIQTNPVDMGDKTDFGRGAHDYSTNFKVSNLSGYTEASLTINFSDNYFSRFPNIFINGRSLGRIKQNSNVSNSTACINEVIKGIFVYYKCPFMMEMDIMIYLKEGTNSFRLTFPGDMETGYFTFSDVMLELKN